MAAFVVLDIDVHDPVRYEEYKKMAPPSIAAHGGKYIARGGKTEIAEGNWNPKRLVILQFENMAKAKAWAESEEYAPARKLRQQSAKTNMVIIEGL